MNAALHSDKISAAVVSDMTLVITLAHTAARMLLLIPISC
jgi:hypothetical protein